MELGSLVCKPDKPQCMLCPVQKHCGAFASGKQNRIPVVKPKEKPTQLIHALVVVRRSNKVLLRQAEAGQWWEGLWEFPRLDLTTLSTSVKLPPKDEVVMATLSSEFGLEVEGLEFETAFTHAVTRYKIRANCYTAAPEKGWRSKPPFAWHPTDDLPALSAPAKKLWKMVH
jgi:A/G-specific adenine glycosylase